MYIGVLSKQKMFLVYELFKILKSNLKNIFIVFSTINFNGFKKKTTKFRGEISDLILYKNNKFNHKISL